MAAPYDDGAMNIADSIKDSSEVSSEESSSGSSEDSRSDDSDVKEIGVVEITDDGTENDKSPSIDFNNENNLSPSIDFDSGYDYMPSMGGDGPENDYTPSIDHGRENDIGVNIKLENDIDDNIKPAGPRVHQVVKSEMERTPQDYIGRLRGLYWRKYHIPRPR